MVVVTRAGIRCAGHVVGELRLGGRCTSPAVGCRDARERECGTVGDAVRM